MQDIVLLRGLSNVDLIDLMRRLTPLHQTACVIIRWDLNILNLKLLKFCMRN